MGIGIWGDVPKVSQIYGSDKVKKAYKSEGPPGVAQKTDDLTISESAKDYNMTMKSLKEVPEIREEKVNEIIKKMDSGDYNVSEKDVADKLVKYLQGNKE